MKNLTLAVAAVLILSASMLGAQKLGTHGKLWLAQYTEPATINVGGAWKSDDWGLVTLKHAEGSREVTGSGDGWDITGVVSGATVYLLFSHHGEINYSAVLVADGQTRLSGSYTKSMFKETSKKRPMLLVR